jgi:two-component system sensor histidine kinase and response regulator WspE
MSRGNPAQADMLDLFRQEAEAQAQVLTAGLLALERTQTAPDQLEQCMRAAHSLKGAARIVGLNVGVRLAHAMEDCFVAAQRGRIALDQSQIDTLLAGTDLLSRVGSSPDRVPSGDVEAVIAGLENILAGGELLSTKSPAVRSELEHPVARAAWPEPEPHDYDRMLRITAENLNHLLGLASESLVESRRVKTFSDSLVRLKRINDETSLLLADLGVKLAAERVDPQALADLTVVQRRVLECQQTLSQRVGEFDSFERRSSDLTRRLYDQALACRMRPFADGVEGYPRMVRDLGRSLGKNVRLEIVGEDTQVDRDILTRLDSPLGHLLRNAVDHGLESPEERLAAGKAEEAIVRLEARHSAGVLHVTISDDGRGIDVDLIRTAVVSRQLATAGAVTAMSDAELLEFLFLPGFTLKETLTEISGRGVGLDAVQNMVKQLRGSVKIATKLGSGTWFQLQLPVTLSVIRTLLADVAGEPYAFPLAAIVRAVRVPRAGIETVEGRQHFDLEGRSIGLITAHQVLGLASTRHDEELNVIVVGDSTARAYGVVVDRFLGERDLVVQPLDPQLGRIKDIAAGALMDDGSPVLIVDTEDMLRSLARIAASNRVTSAESDEPAAKTQRKRVLVVDDSLTVRELERKLLSNSGYEVEVAVDGLDGWNALQNGRFNLVLTDVDMPRMDGIELITLINNDPKLKSVPVMIVSYKDRDEDRRRGLEAGAAHYLTKSSFQEETLAQAVVDLIGEAYHA